MTTIEKIEKGIITLAEFTEDQQSFIRGMVKLSFNEGQEQALRIHDVNGRSEQCNHKFERVEKGGEFRGNQCDCGEWEDLT